MAVLQIPTIYGGTTNSNNSVSTPLTQKALTVQCGIYKCGHDFAPGDIKLNVISMTDKDQEAKVFIMQFLERGQVAQLLKMAFSRGEWSYA